jgi:hypothetical protein
MAEQALRGGEIARLEECAHRRARHARAFEEHVRHRLHLESVLRAKSLKRRVVACALRAKAEIPAHKHGAGAQAAHQHVFDKASR